MLASNRFTTDCLLLTILLLHCCCHYMYVRLIAVINNGHMDVILFIHMHTVQCKILVNYSYVWKIAVCCVIV